MTMSLTTERLLPNPLPLGARPVDPVRSAVAARAYQAAKRHSRFVKFLRVAIPVGAIVSFSAFVVFPFINPFRASNVSVGAVKLDGTRVTMEKPRLSGHRKDNKPYEVTAVSAVQDIRIPNIIELNQMSARLVNADDTVVNLTARKAIFDSQKEQLQLREDVRINTQNGQEVLMRSAEVDFKAGTVRSREGVRVQLSDMNVSANELDIVDSGSQIAFVGKVTAVIDHNNNSPGAAAPGLATQAAKSQGMVTPMISRSGPQPPAIAGQDPVPTASGTFSGPTVIDSNSGRPLARPTP